MKIVRPHSKFFIIGNADEQHSIAHLINEDDIVIRFNAPNPSCCLKADWAFIANGHIQVRYLIITHDLFKPDTCIFLRYTRQDVWHQRFEKIPLHKRIKYQWRFPQWIKRYNLDRYQINTLPSSIIEHCVQLLHSSLPSTGLLAIDYILQNYSDHLIYIHNFTHEGWFGHNWNMEKIIIYQFIKKNKIIKI